MGFFKLTLEDTNSMFRIAVGKSSWQCTARNDNFQSLCGEESIVSGQTCEQRALVDRLFNGSVT